MLLVCLGYSRVSLAQSRQQIKTDSVLTLIRKYYNNQQADSIYALCGVNFKKEIGLDAFRGIAFQNLFPMGSIRETALISFLNNKVGKYRVTFNYATLQLMLSLDQDDKVELFLFQPYKDESKAKIKRVASTNKMLTRMDKQVDIVIRSYIQKANTVGLSAAVIKNGIVHIYNYGETARGDNQIPTADNLYEIGSITKTFTATLLAWYVNKGTVKLNDLITKFLPDSVSSNKVLGDITLEMLSNHTSGLPRLPDNLEKTAKDPINPYKDYNKADLFTYLRNCKLNSKPGEQYAYSNLAVGLLGVILEKVSGKTYQQMVTEIICRPLGMKSTQQHLAPALVTRMVTVYNEEGNVTQPWNFNALAACGALKSSLNDLVIYTKAYMHPAQDQLGKAMQLTRQLTFNQDVKIGLAWHMIAVNGVAYVFHNGGTYGCSSFIAFNNSNNLAVIALSNCGESTDATGIELLKKLQAAAH